jgi:hypothetical protein
MVNTSTISMFGAVVALYVAGLLESMNGWLALIVGITIFGVSIFINEYALYKLRNNGDK